MMSELPLPMTDESLMPFGKFKGRALANVPAHYLLWVYENVPNLGVSFKAYLQSNMDAIKQEIRNSKLRNK